MAVLDPVKVKLVNLPNDLKTVQVPNYPQAPERGSHTLQIETDIFIDSSDFRLQDEPDYFGMAPDKLVGLKYIGKVKCIEVVMKKGSPSEVDYLVCRCLSDDECAEKPKG